MSYRAKRFNTNNPRSRNKTRKKDKPKFGRLTLDGIKYCNELEYRIAVLLKKYSIPFEYSKKFDTVDENGNPNHREVDFWLPEPIEVFWCDEPLQAIEAKGGRLDDRCYHQKKELKNVGVKTWIATPRYVTFWEHYGFLKSRGMNTKRGRRKS